MSDVADQAPDPSGAPATPRPVRPGSGSWSFGWGAGTGIVLTLVALLIVAPPDPASLSSRASVGGWIDANLGHSVARNTVKRILQDHGIEPAPERSRRTPWKSFLEAHWHGLAAANPCQ